MSVLIFGHENDEHSRAVCEALIAEGVSCAIFCNDAYPRATSVSLDPASGIVEFDGPEGSGRFGDFQTVWNRRRKPASLPSFVHEADRAIALSESETFLQELRNIGFAQQIWVNPEVSQFKIRGKTNQLLLARLVGLTVPRTLISNDPGRVREFLRETPRAVAKAVNKQGWAEDGVDIVLPTSPVTISDCDDDASIQMCPMIYQEQIDKAFELRVVVFGDELLCVKLDSQTREESRTDWRNAAPNSFPIEEIAPPASLTKRIRRFCRRADILHGSFDFAVDEDGNAIFFELNVQGQSLWIEDWNPAIRVLDRLVEFLKAPSRHYRYSGVARHAFGSYFERTSQTA